MQTFASVQDQLDLITKGAAEIIPLDALKERIEQSIASGKPMRIKAGFDPTAPDLHLGHTVLIRKLRHFQQLGHTVIFLIGDSTALIGDPTGKSATRKQLSQEEIDKNAETYKEQVFKILDPVKTEVRYNSEWLAKLGFADMIRLAAKATVSQMLEREDFHKRFNEEEPISVHELLYPLAQGYDSVALECDVELGGTDQKFNLLMGRRLQRDAGQPPQIVLMTPIIEGLDGVQKMSKSLGNAIGVSEPPFEMFTKLMTIPDGLIGRYYTLLTDVLPGAIAAIEEEMAAGKLHPMQAKRDLARMITADFSSQEAAVRAEENWSKQFQQGGVSEDLDEVAIELAAIAGTEAGTVRVAKLLVALGLAASNGEANRKLAEGAVKIEGVVVKEQAVPAAATLTVRLGKKAKRALISM
ncbi:tyrosine--tRNA ligase [Granulicella sp. WH15]|uniref:tyrosine--tRNA ligase n=1 Tax=Granulicella sp. WH15 TaxID=2602070 RepID=UPI001367615B|nr:tyrosine--tRNA ligase [Granulicella sp. WH15]QHN05058.1 tyrosine--tRNA ligase [Granulicella sp. WH15]